MLTNVLNDYRRNPTLQADFEGEPVMPGFWFTQSQLYKCQDLTDEFKAIWDLPLDFDEDNDAVIGMYAFRTNRGMSSLF